MINFTLNDDQQNAAKKIFKFLISKDKYFVLSGMAGTGKTYLLQYLNDVIYKNYIKTCKLKNIEPEIKNINYTATTNKAVKVLANMDSSVQTIYSFLNLTVYNDFKTGDTVIVPNKNWKVYSNTLIVIDEASMINEKLMSFINKGLDQTCKVIFVGDQCQIPAVKAKKALVFNQNFPMVDLETLVRNKDNQQLQDLCIKLRNYVFDDYVIPKEELFSYCTILNENNFKQFIFNKFIDTRHSGMFLNYTNNMVKEFNQYLRQLRGFSGNFQTGEVLINNNLLIPSRQGKAYINKNQSILIETELQVLEEIEDEIEEFEIAGDTYSFPMVRYNMEYINGTVGIKVPENYNDVIKLIKIASKHQDWVTKFKLQEIPDLRFRDAQTIHKSQGSTYDWVVLNYDDIISCRQSSLLSRLLYVAVSRAKYEVFIYDRNN